MGIHLFTYLISNRKFLWAYCVPSTVLSIWDTAANKTELPPPGADTAVENRCVGGHRRFQRTPCGRARRSGGSAVQVWDTSPGRSMAVHLTPSTIEEQSLPPSRAF